MRPRHAIAGLLLAIPVPAFAGRPLTTEDASILEEKACQLETWVDHGRDATTGWLVPACNFGANIEWQLGGARTREDGHSRFSGAYLQGKTFWKPSEASAWATGLVVGVTRIQLKTHQGWENPYAILPFTVSSDALASLFHFNIGWSHDRAQGSNSTPWGVAMETVVSPRLTLVAEAFAGNGTRPFLRAGGRYTLIKDRLDMDLTYVTRPGGTRAERFVSLGLFWQTGRFLP